MLWSKFFIPTLRETPAEAEVASHQLLLRARLHPPALRGHLQLSVSGPALAAENPAASCAQEMDAIGAQEMFLPGSESRRGLAGIRPLGRHGRQHVPPQGPFRPRPLPRHDPRRGHDRHRARRAAQLQATAADLVPDPDQVPRRAAPQVRPAARAPVHHEGFLLLRHGPGRASTPLTRSTTRPTAGFSTAAAWTYLAVEAHSGAMGGSQSHEFMVASDAGEDFVAVCPGCGYAANLEKAVADRRAAADRRSRWRPRARGVPHARPQDHRRGGRVHRPARDFADEEPGDGGRWQAGAGAAARRSSAERNQVRRRS